ncbi:MAG: formyltransferase family protein [Patescibacteria group bacterium]|jgi:folate-dependent phosphoribosylglycinamide formyltransferase PurN
MSGNLRLALLISGGGTTMMDILSASRDGRLPHIVPACIIASKKTAGGIEKVHAWGMDPGNILVLRPKDFSSPVAFGEAIIAVCKQRSVDLVGQYGWMPKTPLNVIECYRDMIINQHPGPLDTGRPDFGGDGMYGLRVHAARLYFVRKVGRDFWTEATAQRVHPDFDKGPIIKREQVRILDSDDPVSLQKRVLLAEHRVQVAALHDFCEDHVTIFSRKDSLVRDGEEPILTAAKEAAATLYPKG